MPYGSMHETTREYLIKRAQQSSVPLEKLGFDPDMSFEESLEEDVHAPDNLYQISVIFDGALDEEFYVQTDYEVNIADWIAEQCAEEATHNEGASWEIIVQEYAYEDAGPVRYKVTDEKPNGES